MLAKSTLKAHCSCKGYLLFFDICQEPSTHYYGSAAVDEQELAIPILSLCHGTLTNWSIFSTPFLLWKEGSSGPVTQWRQLVSCDWLWHSHGSLIQSRFDLKINRSMKTPWQEYSCMLLLIASWHQSIPTAPFPPPLHSIPLGNCGQLQGWGFR